MTNPSTNELEKYEKVLSVVRRICRPPADCENIAADIVVEYLGRELPFVAIRNRCYDALRRLKREQERLEEYSKLDVQTVPPFSDEQLGRLILAADLSGLERKVLYMVYAEGLTLQQISEINWHSVREVSDAQYQALEKLKQKARELYE